MHLGAAVGDEALHSVEVPLTGLLILPGAQSHRLKVGTEIRLGEVHRTVVFAARELGQVSVLLLLAAEEVDRLGDVLQTEDVLQRRIGTGDHFSHHCVDRNREVQTAVLMAEHHSHQSGLRQILEILYGQRVIGDHAVGEMRPLGVDRARAGLDPVAADLADHFENAVEVVQRVGVIDRRIVIGLGVFVAVLLQLGGFRQIQMIQREHQIRVVFEKVRHLE